jgi:hypothetical protein
LDSDPLADALLPLSELPLSLPLTSELLLSLPPDTLLPLSAADPLPAFSEPLEDTSEDPVSVLLPASLADPLPVELSTPTEEDSFPEFSCTSAVSSAA